MSHMHPIGVALPADLLEYLDTIRGATNRSVVVRAIIEQWRVEHGEEMPPIKETQRKKRLYGIDTGQTEHIVRAFLRKPDVATWISRDPVNRKQITVRDCPEWASRAFLESLPLWNAKEDRPAI